MRKGIAFVLVVLWLSALPLVAQAAPAKGVAPKNVILVNCDGMGFEHVKAARIYAYGDAVGNIHPFNFEQLPNKNSIMTQNVSYGTTDSAAAASAMATGRKYANGTISYSAGDIPTALEILQARGKRTGLVTTYTPINDASPSAFGAHDTSRYNGAAIAADFFTQTRPNVLYGAPGAGITPADAQNAGYSVVTNLTELNNLDTNTVEFVSGQFNDHSSPSLAARVGSALRILDNDPDGFFLFVEHEGTDEGSHGSNLPIVINSLLEIEDAIDEILAWANGRDDTMIIVLADHETGGLSVTETNPRQGVYPTVSWTSAGNHSSANTPLYAKGAGTSQAVRNCSIDNTDIFRFITTMGGPIVTRTRVNGGTNDAEENTSTLVVDVASTDLKLTYDTGLGINQAVGMRFQSMPIPRGSLITNAYIQFKVDEVSTAAASVTFRAQRGDAAAFAALNGNITGRAVTTASVAWNNIPSWPTISEESLNQRTPDLKTIVQEVVNGGDWSAGNAMAIIATGTGTRTAEAFEGEPANTAELVVEWLPPSKLFWGSYLGGNSTDEAFGVAVAPDGNIVVGGRAYSSDFQVFGGFDTTFGGGSDGYIRKFTPDGALLWSTFVGGSGYDMVNGVAVDKLGNIWACGGTGSSDFPTTGSERVGFDPVYSGGGGFIVKLTPNGGLAWGSYIRGAGVSAITMDASGNAWLTGGSASPNFVVTGTEGTGFDTTLGGDCDAVVMKVTAAGNYAWGSYLGGAYSNGYEDCEGAESIDVGPDGSVWVVGTTRCSDFPIVNGFDDWFEGDMDAFVARISPSTRQLMWSSYLGGSGRDDGYGVAVDNDGNAWVTGSTMSYDFPVYSGIERVGYDTTYDSYWETFAAKITPAGELAWATYLNGDGSTVWNSAVAIDPQGNALITGSTQSPTAPTQGVEGSGFDTTFNGSIDVYVLKITAGGDFAWGTFLGGSEYEGSDAIASDWQGRAIVAGHTASGDFPTPNGYDTTYGYGQAYGDGFICVLGSSAENRLENRVAASGTPTVTSNDAEEAVSTGVMSLTSTDLELVTDGTVVQKVGVRFANLGIPKNAIITKAFIQFSEDEEIQTAATSLTIKGEAADNSAIFTTGTWNITNRTNTAATLYWTPGGWSRADAVCPDQRLSDVRGIVQEIVNRANWASNNGLSFIITGAGRRNAWAVDGSVTRAPLLHVEWIPAQ